MTTKGNMKRKTFKRMVPAAVLLTLGFFAVADVAWSQPPDGSGGRRGRMGRRGGPGGAGGLMLPLGRLDLTEAQRGQVRSVMEQNREASRAAGARLREVRAALRDAITTDVVNEGAIRAVAAELANAEGDVAVQRAFVRSQVWQLLTPDQQATALKVEAEMKERMEQRRARRGERGERRGPRRDQG
ncbi:MAG: Spy/CpxP family protein refolding chaperone [Ilumatobacter sp.]|nr:Spy/CpxP family protein refolding chaperone [Ilumatobacter sp.]